MKNVVWFVFITVLSIFNAFAENDVKKFNNFNFVIENNEITIVDYVERESLSYNDTDNNKRLCTIPEEIAGFPVVSIADNALDGEDLTQIYLPESLKHIGIDAFRGLRISSITIPNSVTEIGEGAFSNCRNLKTFTISPGHSVYGVIDGVLYDKSKKMLHTFLSYVGKTSFEVPEGILSIGNRAFSYNRDLRKVILPETTTSIGYEAFIFCQNLSVVVLPAVKSIGDYAFNGCDDLRELHIPKCLESIGVGAFRINNGYASSDFKLTIDDDNPSYNVIDNALFDKNNEVLIAYFRLNGNRKENETYIVPEGVVCIAEYAFEDTPTHYIVLPSSLKIIKKNAFSSPSIYEITFQNGLEQIEENAFLNSKKLENIEFPSSLVSIGNEAFQGCVKLNTVRLPSTITYIGKDVFTYVQKNYNYGFGSFNSAFYRPEKEVFNLDVSLIVDENSYSHTYALENDLIFEFPVDTSWL